MSKPNPQTQNQPNTRASSEPVAKGAASAAEEAAAGKHAATAAAAHGDEDDPTNCPICRYIEEGPCAEEHIAWRICKSAAKKEGVDVDWVERCTAEFKKLLGCMIQHKDYHEPLFEALQMDVERSSEMMQQGTEAARSEGEQQQQQQP